MDPQIAQIYTDFPLLSKPQTLLQMPINLQLSVVQEPLKPDVPDLNGALRSVGALVLAQTQERIATGKASPEGEAWAEWSAKYASTRHGGQSLLVAGGQPGLLGSFAVRLENGAVEVGTNLIYAAHHHYGSDKTSGRGSGIPARPFMGLSAADEAEIRDVFEGAIR